MRKLSQPKPWQALMLESDLNSLQRRCEKLAQLTFWVNENLSDALKNHVKVVSYDKSVLKLEVTSSTILMRFKYEQTQLMSILRAKSLPELSSISCSVNPKLSKVSTEKLKQWKQRKEKSPHSFLFSEKTKNQLASFASSVENESLKRSILRLIKEEKE